MNAQGKLQRCVEEPRQLDQLPQRVRTLSVGDAVVLDRSIAPPVTDAGEGVRGKDALGRPTIENDRRQRGNPLPLASWHAGAGPSNELTDGDEMGVTVETHGLAREMPDPVEAGIQVEEGPHRDSL